MRGHARVRRAVLISAVAVGGQLAFAAAAFADGAISGTVTDSGGPVEGICVRALDHDPAEGGLPAPTLTDATGSYAISGLAAATYRVQFAGYGGACSAPRTHVTEYFSDKPSYAAADAVTVNDGATTSSIDATLTRFGSISGTLTGPGGGVAGACVQLFAPGDSGGSGSVVTFTQAGGTFLLQGLDPGDYRVRFAGQDSCPFPGVSATGFVAEFWEDEYLSRNADPIHVGSEQQVTINPVVAASKPPRTSISGTVRDDNGPRAGVCVQALDSGFPAASTVSGAGGLYAINDVEDGFYTLRFFTLGCVMASGPDIVSETYSDKPVLGIGDLVAVPDSGGVSGIDALVNVPPQTTITSGPTGDTGGSDAVFTFSSDDPAARFECVLGPASGPSGEFSPCTSPTTYAGVATGGHRFLVRAVDVPGDPDPTPASVSWNVVPGGDTSSGGTAPPGGTVSSDPAGLGATAAHPVTTAVTVPAGGDVTIQERANPSTDPPRGFSLLGYEIEITAPPATVDDPLRIAFTLDKTILDGADLSSVTAVRDGRPAGGCSGPRADPDPCVADRRTLSGGDLELTVLTSHASTWNFGEAVCVVPKLIGKPLAKSKKALAAANCKLGKVKKKASKKKAGTVIAQKPKPKTEKPVGAKVAVTVSKG